MPHFDGHINYDRVVPDRFSEERDDRLMNSLISNYALEVRDVNGQPTGHFFLNKEQAKLAADEISGTHDTSKVDSRTFEDTWNHFDVNNDGLIEVERGP